MFWTAFGKAYCVSIRKEYWSWPYNILRLTLLLHPRPNYTLYYGRHIKNVGHNSKRSTTGRVEVHYEVRVSSFIDRHWPSSEYTSGPRFELLGQVTWRQGVWSRRLGWESMLGDEISPSRSRTHARLPLTPWPTSLLSPEVCRKVNDERFLSGLRRYLT